MCAYIFKMSTYTIEIRIHLSWKFFFPNKEISTDIVIYHPEVYIKYIEAYIRSILKLILEERRGWKERYWETEYKHFCIANSPGKAAFTCVLLDSFKFSIHPESVFQVTILAISLWILLSSLLPQIGQSSRSLRLRVWICL